MPRSRWAFDDGSCIGVVRVLGVAGDYVVCRFKNAAPFCVHRNEFKKHATTLAQIHARANGLPVRET